MIPSPTGLRVSEGSSRRSTHPSSSRLGSDRLYTEAGRGLVEVACWAHARRKWYEARSSDLEGAATPLGYIGLLYKIERRARGLDRGERLAVPVLEHFQPYLERGRGRALPKSPEGVAVGRRNWTFFGSDGGGRTAAVGTSFIASCQRLKIDPWAYLHDVLRRIAEHPVNALDQLLPANWTPATA